EGTRAIILVEVTRISDSCGYGVPLLKFERERAELPAWCRKRGTEGLKIYRRGKTDRVWMDCRAGASRRTDSRRGSMKNYFAACLACLWLVCGGCAQNTNAPAKPLSPLEQELMSAEKSFVDAAKKGDVAFFKSTLTDDFSFVAFDGQLYNRQDMLDQFA